MEAPPPVTTSQGLSLARTFHALRYRDFRLYWLALAVSLLGVAFQTVAQSWLVFRLTGSEFMLGLAGFIPAVLSAPASIVGGVLADRVSRRNLVIVTQTLMIVPPTVLAYLIWTQQVQVWHVIVASTVLGTVAAIDLPARFAMVPQLVAMEDLLNAQSLSSAVRQLTRIVGPALAGTLIASAGEAVCFLANGVSYAAMVLALALMKPQPALVREKRQGMRVTLLAGVHYVMQTPALLGLFGMIAAQGLFLTPYITFLTVYATKIFNIGASGLGWLNAAVGLGALLAAVFSANLREGQRGRYILFGSLLTPLALAAFAWSPNGWIAVPFLMVLGAGTVFITAISATMLLVIVPDELRGRVNSLGLLIFLGAPQVGGLVTGWVAERWSTPLALSLTAAAFLLSIVVINMITPQTRQLE